MPTPRDYVARLSLTFEQANLDYSRGYAKVFADSGDRETAAILNRIYRDEIGHVNYGLEWFRKWKGREEDSDWRTFVSCLQLPLSAARAKGGFAFNEEGRREAGLDDEFIRELKVYVQSKGRTPNVFWFNPGAEESLVSSGGAPTRAARQVERDLALLPAFLARREDVVIVPEAPPTSYLAAMQESGVALPEIIARLRVGELAARKLHQLRPWARTPDALPLIEELGVGCDLTEPALFSKATHVEFLGKLLERPVSAMTCPREVVGAVCSSPDEVGTWLAGSSFADCVLKAPFSTAGRNRLLRKVSEALTDDENRWIDAIIRSHGAVVIEPWLERELDFSIQYDMESDGRLRRRGLVILSNTRSGQFRRATVADRFTDFLDEETRRSLFEGASQRGHLVALLEEHLEPALTDLCRGHGYLGPVGVDAFLYRCELGQVRIKPVVEINPRYTMGRVAIELDRFTPAHVVTSLTVCAG